MGSIRNRGGLLFFDFRFRGVRCREQTLLHDTPENRRRMEVFMEQIEKEIKQGTFSYEKYFPNSGNLVRLAQSQPVGRVSHAPTATPVPSSGTPSFRECASEWYLENEVAWKISYKKTLQGTLEKHLYPVFGEKEVSHITKGDILKFRSSLAKVPIRKRTGLSPTRINHIMTSLRMILNDAADRHQFSTPFIGIKPLKVPPSDVDPLSFDEVNLLLANVRTDFRDYYLVRFFTGLRTGEIDGLQWKYVDFARRLLLIRETLVEGRIETPKTPGSIREVYMSGPVLEAMKRQFEGAGHLEGFVFCTRNGNHLDHRNMTQQIWYATLKLLKGVRISAV